MKIYLVTKPQTILIQTDQALSGSVNVTDSLVLENCTLPDRPQVLPIRPKMIRPVIANKIPEDVTMGLL